MPHNRDKTITSTDPRAARESKTGQAHPVDRHVGERIRLRRVMLGLSQKSLAESIGVKFPQVQKYEEGINRISASRLFAVSRVLAEPISYFFDRMDGETDITAPGDLSDDRKAFVAARATQGRDDEGLILRPETLDLVRIYYGIEDRRLRRSILVLMAMLAEPEDDNENDGGTP